MGFWHKGQGVLENVFRLSSARAQSSQKMCPHWTDINHPPFSSQQTRPYRLSPEQLEVKGLESGNRTSTSGCSDSVHFYSSAMSMAPLSVLPPLHVQSLASEANWHLARQIARVQSLRSSIYTRE